MPTKVRVTVYESAIAAEFLPGGQAWNQMTLIGSDVAQVAIRTAPSRTGNLRRQHNVAVTPVGKYQCRFSVGNYADYADYVHGGTTGPIMPHGDKLWIRAAPYSRYPHGAVRFSVAGQKANPWIRDAAEAVGPRWGFTGKMSVSY